jgi:hypothetical protein
VGGGGGGGVTASMEVAQARCCGNSCDGYLGPQRWRWVSQPINAFKKFNKL